jgi:hypothetical protein
MGSRRVLGELANQEARYHAAGPQSGGRVVNRLGDVVADYCTDVDFDVIRAWWSLRSLRAARWLVDHGFDPWPEVAVLRSRL